MPRVKTISVNAVAHRERHMQYALGSVEKPKGRHHEKDAAISSGPVQHMQDILEAWDSGPEKTAALPFGRSR
jgi:hypothetical protein